MPLQYASFEMFNPVTQFQRSDECYLMALCNCLLQNTHVGKTTESHTRCDRGLVGQAGRCMLPSVILQAAMLRNRPVMTAIVYWATSIKDSFSRVVLVDKSHRYGNTSKDGSQRRCSTNCLDYECSSTINRPACRRSAYERHQSYSKITANLGSIIDRSLIRT